ncbi:hypothetical protein DFH07DRAFT_768251 [Mycena maculata]|uniref:Uncharacterized protein n=1 Tax=Mycena maculata TaxID=230809 RepID=A0AAD7JSZ3_9AGAR|nr:hypothetical protein DFH07DRAFT_768251 [Mycena maculata]
MGQSKFTREQADYIARFLPAILAKSESSSPVELTAYKILIKTKILQSPLFMGNLPTEKEDPVRGTDAAGWDECILKKFANSIGRKTSTPFLEFHPLSGIRLFEKEHKFAIIAEAPKSAEGQLDDQTYETHKIEMWTKLGKEAQDTYELRAAEFPQGVETAATKALTKLCSGGQVGHLETLTHWAFRTLDGELKHGVIHGHGVENVPDMTESNDPITFSEQWIKFAHGAIPHKDNPHPVGENSGEVEVVIPRGPCGIPLFPVVDMKRLTSNDLIPILATYLEQLWDHTGPGSRWLETGQDPNLYYDKSHSPPVIIKAPEAMTMMEIFSLAQFFADTSSVDAFDPFSFNQSGTPVRTLENAAAIMDLEGPDDKPKKKPRWRKSTETSVGAVEESSIAARRTPRQPAPRRDVAIPTEGRRPGYDIAVFTSDEVQHHIGIVASQSFDDRPQLLKLSSNALARSDSRLKSFIKNAVLYCEVLEKIRGGIYEFLQRIFRIISRAQLSRYFEGRDWISLPTKYIFRCRESNGDRRNIAPMMFQLLYEGPQAAGGREDPESWAEVVRDVEWMMRGILQAEISFASRRLSLSSVCVTHI